MMNRSQENTQPFYIESSLVKENAHLDQSLRPQTLESFLGQQAVREKLTIVIEAAKRRKEALGHCLFYGPPGLGKTTLAHIIAQTMGSELTISSGPVLEKAGDLAGILTNLKEGDILFIDEIHRIPRSVEEYLYPAMENFRLDLMIDSGPSARTVQVKLNPFTLVGATTRFGQLTAPMRSRFPFVYRLDHYSPEVLQQIVMRSARILQVPIEPTGALEIARRARGTPRIANNLLRWVRDWVQIHENPSIDQTTALLALEKLSIDSKGFDEMDLKILSILIDHYGGRAVGLNTLADALNEDPITVQEVYEPYLIVMGFLERTPRGRRPTALAYAHLGRKLSTEEAFS